MKIAGNKKVNANNNKTVVMAIVAVLVVVALIVALIILLPSKKDEGAKPTTTKSNAPITGIRIDSISKTSYLIGDELDRSTITIKVLRKDGTSTLISGNDPDLSFSELDSTVMGSCRISVVYKGEFTDYFTVNVVRPPEEIVGTVTGISINSTPTTIYYLGDTYDPSEIEIAVTVAERDTPYYIDGTHPELEFSGFDSSVLNDELILTVSFRGVSTTYAVAIKDPSYADYVIMSLNISSMPHQTTYGIDHPFNSNGLVVQVVTDNQYTNFFVDASDPKLIISGFDSSVATENQVITVTYEGVSTTFTVTIKDYDAPQITLESIEVINFYNTYTVERWNKNGPTLYGAYLKLTYSDGSTKGSYDETPLLWDYVGSLSKVDGPGTIELIVTYQGKTTTVTITITE